MSIGEDDRVGDRATLGAQPLVHCTAGDCECRVDRGDRARADTRTWYHLRRATLRRCARSPYALQALRQVIVQVVPAQFFLEACELGVLVDQQELHAGHLREVFQVLSSEVKTEAGV